jgi:hypothetical protein
VAVGVLSIHLQTTALTLFTRFSAFKETAMHSRARRVTARTVVVPGLAMSFGVATALALEETTDRLEELEPIAPVR